METNEKVNWEGNYIHTQNGKHGKVISNNNTTLTIKWYPAWQWFFVIALLALWQLAAQIKRALVASVRWLIRQKLNVGGLAQQGDK